MRFIRDNATKQILEFVFEAVCTQLIIMKYISLFGICAQIISNFPGQESRHCVSQSVNNWGFSCGHRGMCF